MNWIEMTSHKIYQQYQLLLLNVTRNEIVLNDVGGWGRERFEFE